MLNDVKNQGPKTLQLLCRHYKIQHDKLFIMDPSKIKGVEDDIHWHSCVGLLSKLLHF
jgi:hypothetical protein